MREGFGACSTRECSNNERQIIGGGALKKLQSENDADTGYTIGNQLIKSLFLFGMCLIPHARILGTGSTLKTARS